MRHLIPFCLSLAVVAGPMSAQGTELPGVREAADRVAKALNLDGAGVAVVRADAELHRSLHGAFAADTVLPIASASKWLAVATILTLVDEGKLELDLPVARYVEEFDRDDKRRLTLRQCLACASGLPARLGGRMRGWDMDRFAEEAADEGLRSQPGFAFLYGGVGFQVVAVAAERVTGKDWHTLFAERIAEPLGMKHTRFGSLQPLGGEPGKAALPWVAGGAVSTLNDYARFVRMLLAEGRWHGAQVISKERVAEMLRDNVPPLVDVRAAAMPGADVRYGLGTWVERLDDDRVRLSDPGALGFTPWIDPDLGVAGVFAVQDRVRRVLRQLGDVQDTVREAVTSPAVAGTSEQVELRHDGRTRRYELHVPPHEENTAGLPLLVVLHGGGGNGDHARRVTELDRLGVQKGFVVAFPDGTGRLPRKLLTWNSGGVDAYASRNDVDDVGFLKELVTDVKRRVPIDPARVYAVGHSNGGMMCHRLAREAADTYRGIAVVAGAMNYTDADPAAPIAVLLVHGTKDAHVPIAGGVGEVQAPLGKERVDASLQDAVDYYVTRNGLVAYPVTDVDEGVRIDRYTRARRPAGADPGTTSPVTAPVWVLTLEGGGHAWPGTDVRPVLLRDTPHPWDASRGVLEFFQALGQQSSTRDGMVPAVPR